MASNSGSIDEIIGQAAIAGVDVTTAKMEALHKAFVQNVTAINLMNNALAGATGARNTTAGIDEITRLTNQLAHAQTAAAQEAARLREELNRANAANRNTATSVNAATGSYAALDAELNRLTAAYRRMTEAERNSQFGVQMHTQITGLRGQLTALDASMGVHSRNVGNYSNSIVSAFSRIYSGIRTIANILPGLGISGVFLLGYEAIVKVVEELGLFNKTLDSTKAKLDIVEELEKANKVAEAMAKITDLQKLFSSATISTTEKLRVYNEVMGKIWDKETNYAKAKQNLIDLSPSYIQMLEDEAYADLASKHLAELQYKKDLDAKQNSIKNNPTTGIYDESGDLKNMLDKLKLHFATVEGIKESFYVNGQQKGMNDAELQNKIDEKNTKQIEADLKVRKSVYDEAYAQGLISKAKYEEALKKAGVTPGDGKTDKPKEINRIDDLKKEYEARKVAEQQKQADMPEGLRSEVEYRHNLLKATEEYVTKMHSLGDKLSTNEKNSRTTLHKEMLDDTQSNTKELEKIQIDKLKKDDEYYKLQSEAAKRNLEEAGRIGKLHADDEKKRDEEEAKHNSATIKNTVKTEKEIADIKQARYNMEVALLRSSFDIANSISDAIYAKELQQIEDKATALEEAHNREIKQIEQSGLTSIQQTKAKAKADAQYEAEKKKIDKDRKKALYNQALLNKALTMSEVVLATTLAVMNALSNKATVLQSVRFANAIAAGAIGAAQFFKAAAVKLPEYAKGRGKGKDEMAIVGEAGTEAIIRGDGRVEITPNRATTTFLKADDQVISNSELMRSIQNSAYVSLSNKGTFTTDKLQNALINEFEKNTNEIKDLKKVLINKNLSVNTTNYGGFDSYLKSHIR